MRQTVTNLIDNDYKDYSKYVLYSRAIPSLIDGLKPSQRKILYTATKVAKTSRIKTASLAGAVIEKANYHHGDASLNDAINKMAQTFNNNLPLLSGEGSFGSRLVQEAAAARYTFVRLNDNFNKYFVDTDILLAGEDPEDPEPRFYLPTIPWVLVNGISGIAVGFATEIQPRNPEQLQKVCRDYLNGKNIDKTEIPPYYEDFTGDIKRESDGKWYCYGVWRVSGTKLDITEVPIGFDREKYVSTLDKLETDGKIVSYKDLCDKNGFKFQVTLKRGKKLTDNQIVKMFKLSKVLNENLTTIDENGNLRIFDNVNDIIKHFVDYRLTHYDRRFEHYVNRDTQKQAIVSEKIKFVKGVLNGEIVIKNKSKNQLNDILTKSGFKHLDKLTSMPIYNLCQDELDKLEDQWQALDDLIAEWQATDSKEAYIQDLT